MATSSRWVGRRGLVWPTAVALVAASVVPIVLLGAILITSQQRSLTAQAADHVDDVADAQLARLEQVRLAAVTGIRLIASRTQMRQDFAELLAGDTTNQDRLLQILDDALEAAPDVRTIALVTLDGEVAASAGAGVPSVPARSLDVADVGTIGSHVVGDDGVRWLVSAPLILDDELLGVVVLDVDPTRIVSLVADLGAREVALTTCVYHRTADGGAEAFVEAHGSGARCSAGATPDDRAVAVPVVETATDELAAIALRGESRLLLDAVDVGGNHVIAATRHLPELDWGLTVAVARDELLAPIASTTRLMVGVMVGVALLATLAAVLIARWLTRPIQALRDVALAAQSDAEVRADPIAPGELGELAAAINAMTATLHEQRRDLERRYDDLEMLSHAMAHDLVAPLTGIRGGYEALALGRVTDEADRLKLLDRGVSAAERMQRLIDELVVLMRTVGAPIEMAPVSLDEVVDTAIDDLGLDSVVVRSRLGVVLGDRILLDRLIVNLLGNAVKYHRPGEQPRIEVSVEPVGAGRVAVHVDDAGIGIPVDEREAVLSTFARGTEVTSVGGSGIGLSIVARVVSRHGGDLRIGDSPLGGTRVTITLEAHESG